jgi:hypothetical protein
MSLEPEHEARRFEIEQSWTDQQRMDRLKGETLEYLIQHFATLYRRAEEMRIYLVEHKRMTRQKQKGEQNAGT